MTITKKELAQIIAEAICVSPKKAEGFLSLMLEFMAEALEKGEKVKLAGFGTFTVHSKRARRGRNSQTGGEMEISARKVVTFKPSPMLRKGLKQGQDKRDRIKMNGISIVQEQ